MALLFLGDFLYDYDNMQDDLEEIAIWIKKRGYRVILNLEGPITDDFSKKRKKRGPNLYQKAITIDVLKKLQVVGVCLSNNHIMDYGDIGLEKTIKILDENNIKHAGAGCNLLEASRPMIINDDGEMYEIFNFGWDLEETVYAEKNQAGCSPRTEENIYRCLKESNNSNYRKVAIMHWGFEYNYLPMPLDIDLAHKMIEAGYDIIVGHHPHVVQPKEIYKEKVIYYSIGNFYMGTRRNNYYNRLEKELLGIGVLIEKNGLKQFDINYSIVGTRIGNSLYEEDITGVNFKSMNYVKKCKLNSKNYTPILTDNCFTNFVKILCLKSFYALYAKVKFLRKNKKK